MTPLTVAYQAPLPMRFSRLEYWSGLPFPSPGIFLTQGSNLSFLHILHWRVDYLLLSHWEALTEVCSSLNLPFHAVHGVLKARILKWFAIPFSSGPHSVRPLYHDPPILAWLSFIELGKAVVLV